MASITLVDGPLAGKEVPEFSGYKIVFPFVRDNDERDDQILGDWSYDRAGRFMGEKILTTTMNLDAFKRTMEWLWRDW